MKTVYVVTDTRTRPGFRRVLVAVLAVTLLAGAVLGHIAALAAGAVVELLAAALGLPRAAWLTRQAATVVRDTWKGQP